jgi:outer membrane protein OmpA-like peptidoglycan-associated protein
MNPTRNYTPTSHASGALAAACLLSLLILAGAAAPAWSAVPSLDAQQELLTRIPGTTVERVDANTLLVHLDSDTLFAPDSATLDTGGRSAVAAAAGVINGDHTTAVVVQGHTDAVGTGEHNRALSERRARAVAGYLIGHGVDPARVTSVGLGETRPVARNETPTGRRQNRRVDILLKADATALLGR